MHGRTSSLDRPDVAELLERAREIAGVARERALETETARRVSDDVVARMRQADLFRVMQPEIYGGFEYGFDVFAKIEAILASGCGSTGWVYGLLASHQWLIACFPQEAQEEVWRDRTALRNSSTCSPLMSACDFFTWRSLSRPRGMISQRSSVTKIVSFSP